MIRNLIYKTAYNFISKEMYQYYEHFLRNRQVPLEVLEREQNRALNKLMVHAFENIPYYMEIAKKYNLTADDILTAKDLEKLPILTKSTIKSRPEDFKYKGIKKYKKGRTGGSTGEPLSFIMSPECYYRGSALSLARYNQAGFVPGDMMINMGGGSIVGNPNLTTKARRFLLHSRAFSSYGFNEDTLNEVYRYIRKQKRLYFHGYASSIYILSKYIIDNKAIIEAHGGIFSTSEQLFPSQREVIQKAFPNCDIFDAYGLNDGGITACECTSHNGKHVEYGRGLMEIVDENDMQINNKPGRILATSLYNYAFPFIRYDTGDMGAITYEECSCGLHTPRLTELIGRQTDYLQVGNIKVGSPVLTVLMGTMPQIAMYRVVQKDEKTILFKICFDNPEYIREAYEKEKVINKIRESFLEKVPGAVLEFEFVETLVEFMDGVNKHKIITNLNKKS